MSAIGTQRRRGLALLAVLAATPLGLAAQSLGQASMEAGAALLDGSPAAASSLSASFEKLGDQAAARGACNFQGRAGNGMYGSAEGRGEFSWTPGTVTTVLAIEGGASGGSTIVPSWRGAGSFLLALDSFDLSGDFKAGLERRSDLGTLSTVATAGLGSSFTQGELLLKPRLDASASWADSGTTTWTFLPGLGIAWYPGLPVSASLAAGWSRALWTGGTADSLVAEASLYAAFGAVYASVEASTTFSTSGVSAASAALGLSLEAGRLGPARLSIPTRVSYLLGGNPVLSLFAGVAAAMD